MLQRKREIVQLRIVAAVLAVWMITKRKEIERWRMTRRGELTKKNEQSGIQPARHLGESLW